MTSRSDANADARELRTNDPWGARFRLPEFQLENPPSFPAELFSDLDAIRSTRLEPAGSRQIESIPESGRRGSFRERLGLLLATLVCLAVSSIAFFAVCPPEFLVGTMLPVESATRTLIRRSIGVLAWLVAFISLFRSFVLPGGKSN